MTTGTEVWTKGVETNLITERTWTICRFGCRALIDVWHEKVVMSVKVASRKWKENCQKRSYLLLGTEPWSPRFGGALGCCCLWKISGWVCCLETKWAGYLGNAHQPNSHCHKTFPGSFYCSESERSNREIKTLSMRKCYFNIVSNIFIKQWIKLL